MTLYYTLCFGLLMSELLLFTTIICPMPFAMRKKMFHFLSENPVVAKVQYALKITFIFVAVLFIDALQRMVRIAQEGAGAKMKNEMPDVRTETNYAARKFYAQRNLYLTGATLFLSLILSRVFYIILDFIHVQENYSTLQQRTAKASGAAGESEELRKRIKELEAQVESGKAQGRDFDNLKKQAAQQNAEYNRLADEHAKATGSTSNKKHD
ncbi:B-cell receptor-associated protein 31-like-domain-containing protein [Kockovaella imperatae]|uniref:Endoplasmic reticulum transmembrane protein n=1 Tax=Kockovaella imperatae TaxID=4999 RepID=A0A1Y1UIE0_9TREE|nr:B-cell receptor-associated protein 31-like-domain-containing protein [Kockovaella imperatae]ORX37254.1 B-cell receptor-associated protein 31-like-domain-containing protein [Kockovaella imperatae]